MQPISCGCFKTNTKGGEQLKKGYTKEEVNNLNNNTDDDFDLRKYYNYYNVNNVTIENCKISKKNGPQLT